MSRIFLTGRELWKNILNCMITQQMLLKELYLPYESVGLKQPIQEVKEAGTFLKAFLEHVVNGKNYATGKKGSPLDFITFHAKGQPRVTNGTVWMNVGVQLRHIDKGFQIVSSFPTLKNLPIIIGESDPEGCAACPADIYPNNGYRNGTLVFELYGCFFCKKI